MPSLLSFGGFIFMFNFSWTLIPHNVLMGFDLCFMNIEILFKEKASSLFKVKPIIAKNDCKLHDCEIAGAWESKITFTMKAMRERNGTNFNMF